MSHLTFFRAGWGQAQGVALFSLKNKERCERTDLKPKAGKRAKKRKIHTDLKGERERERERES